ncbi:hypothetical protein [Salinimicrobium sp. GXAS 041]|uniref:hypothetical protein n=1 Tax=Salinimicrobium sp. GXAS 041 TaxID=3400806 RepID=UPI003C71F7B4
MKKAKKIGISILAVVAGIFLALFLLSNYAKNKITSTLEEEMGENLQYEEVDVSLISRRIKFENPEIIFSGNTINAEEISINGIGLYQYLMNKKIRINDIELASPVVTFSEAKDTAGTSGDAKKFKQDIKVGSFSIENGEIRTVKNDTSETPLFALLDSFRLSDIVVNPETLDRKIPFDYNSYSFRVDSVYMALDDQHDFSVGHLSSENGRINLERFRILPKYDKVEFQRHIPYEKDRFELLVESVQLDSLSWRFKSDSLHIENPLMTIRGADLEVYRNKLVQDDPRTKTLYSEKIRKMPFKIDFDSIHVERSKIVYEEKVKEDRPPGKVSFHEVEAGISNISNMGLQGSKLKTVINANALFMDVTPLEVDWQFDIGNEWESFSISGNFGTVPARAINEFVRPAMNVEVEGNIDYLAFSYSGNDDKALGDVRIQYRDFRVVILKDDGEEKNSFWSSIANLFISNNAVDEDVVNKDLEVTRDKKKSFWNYAWLMIREGALASFL